MRHRVKCWLRTVFCRDEGFTLIELMVVVAIMAILAGGGLVAYNGFIARAVNSVAESMARALDAAVTTYEIEHSRSLADLATTEDVRRELAPYVDVPLTVLGSGDSPPSGPPTGGDQVWVQCPAANSKKWKVWVARSNRLSKEATFDGEFDASGTGCAAASSSGSQ